MPRLNANTPCVLETVISASIRNARKLPKKQGCSGRLPAAHIPFQDTSWFPRINRRTLPEAFPGRGKICNALRTPKKATVESYHRKQSRKAYVDAVATDFFTRPHPDPDRKLPDPAICRAHQINYTNLYGCLVNEPVDCKYALKFGGGFLCRHPERAQIAANTKPGHKSGVAWPPPQQHPPEPHPQPDLPPGKISGPTP